MNRGSRNRLHDRVQQHPHAILPLPIAPLGDLERPFVVLGAPSPPRARVQCRIIHLLLVGPQIIKQIQQFRFRLAALDPRPRVRPIGLVQYRDGTQTERQRPSQHVLGLGFRSLGRVHDQYDAVDHGQYPIDLSGEIGVAGSIDDVHDGRFPRLGAGIIETGHLGRDGDAPFLFELSGIHESIEVGRRRGRGRGGGVRPFSVVRILRRRSSARHGGLEKFVDQRGLSVIDVRHDRDVPDSGAATERVRRRRRRKEIVVVVVILLGGGREWTQSAAAFSAAEI
mmetsp:Transcript_28833/g.85116  ORF Transcript_28833/g.85116 Transcript_28833/m.85116 type:complete len:282 (-) Transcript_28833:355-1200(-)